MGSDDTDGWLAGAVADGREVVREARSFLGVEREAHVCPECNVACDETRVHDAQRMAFDGGASPAWTCPECATDYVREADDADHTMDLYGRGPPE